MANEEANRPILSRLKFAAESLRMEAKGFVLVSVPLLFQVIIVLALLITIFQTDRELEKASMSRKLVEVLRLVDASNSACSALLTRYGLSIADEYRAELDELIRAYESQLLGLTNLNYKKKSEDLSKIIAGHKEFLELVKKGEDLISLGLRKEASPLLLRGREVADRMWAIEHNFMQHENRVSVRSPEFIRHSATQLQAVLSTAVVLNILAAGLIAAFFGKNIVSRLLLIYDNSRKYAAGKEPHNKVTGTDEIAELDHEFRSMVSAINQMRKSERAAMDASAELICSLDKELRLLAFNNSLRFLAGTEELKGRALETLIVAGDRVKLRHARDLLLGSAKQTEYSFEARLIGESGGKQIYFSWSLLWSPFEEAFFLIGRDISEEKAIERQRSEMLSMVSHDLRSPLTSMKLGVQALLEGYMGRLHENERSRELLLAVDENAKSLLKLVDRFLQAERIESSRIDLDLKPLALEPSMRKFFNSQIDKLQPKSLRLRLDLNLSENLLILANTDAFFEVLENLLDNAIRFSPRGEEIIVEAFQENGFCMICVCDNGPGIESEWQERVFERYRNLKKHEEAGEQTSLGLGLPLCKKIIEAHDGEIGIVSGSQSCGTKIWFKLPMAETEGFENT